ncbi:AMP-binding protein [Streptomyces sp. CA-249302]|uniref:AMP-binding protein n=1 Tax=Streptomyces sp. CA-249302 TaxID=3240058 RepID=UPI003D90632F
MEAFVRSFGPLGVAESAMAPCYGMAEATLAITLPVPGTRPHCLSVHRAELQPGQEIQLMPSHSPESIRLVAVGAPVPGMELKIVSEEGASLPAGYLGEIVVRGPSLTTGYRDDPAATRSALRDGWLHTGDLGFLHEEALYVAGRLKDMISVRGRNFYPDDVEHAVGRVPDVYRGRCVAIPHPLQERMAVVVETALSAQDASRDHLVNRIERELAGSLGLSAVRVHLVPPRSLPRTSSGKWQRHKIRDLLPSLEADDKE